MIKKMSNGNGKKIVIYTDYITDRLIIAFLITIILFFLFFSGTSLYSAIITPNPILKEKFIGHICIFVSFSIIAFLFAIFSFFELRIKNFLSHYEISIQDKITIKFKSEIFNYSFYENYKTNIHNEKIIKFIKKKIKNRKNFFGTIISFLSIIILFSIVESYSLVNNDLFSISLSIIILIAGVIITNGGKGDKKENENYKISNNDFLKTFNDFVNIMKNYNKNDIYNYKLKFPIYLLNDEGNDKELILEIQNGKEYINKIIFFNNVIGVYFLNHGFDSTIKLGNKNKRKKQKILLKKFINKLEKIKKNFDSTSLHSYYDDYENFLNEFTNYSTYFEERKIKKIFYFLFLNFNIDDISYDWNELYSLNKNSNKLLINYYQLHYLEYLFMQENYEIKR